MEISEKAKCQEYLDAWKFLNGGNGLVVPMHLAKRLRAMGIEGPFVESKPLPTCTPLASMRY